MPHKVEEPSRLSAVEDRPELWSYRRSTRALPSSAASRSSTRRPAPAATATLRTGNPEGIVPEFGFGSGRNQRWRHPPGRPRHRGSPSRPGGPRERAEGAGIEPGKRFAAHRYAVGEHLVGHRIAAGAGEGQVHQMPLIEGNAVIGDIQARVVPSQV